ncbi:hypothetical protein DPMN_005407 [Dreissena polymorpha]|uniref:Uncharacterized protein n=1 Tax=Dreissena polymorpha TaxID=45954 RepID=A0A9D4MS45_DREPO|nr:hypothetical protein DPMN_005407 [Dreissena polymorpha]
MRHPHLLKSDKHDNGKRKDNEASSSKATYSSPSKSKKQQDVFVKHNVPLYDV